MKTYRTLSNQFEMTIERKPSKQYLYISSIPGNAKASAIYFGKKKISYITQEIYSHNQGMYKNIV